MWKSIQIFAILACLIALTRAAPKRNISEISMLDINFEVDLSHGISATEYYYSYIATPVNPQAEIHSRIQAVFGPLFYDDVCMKIRDQIQIRSKTDVRLGYAMPAVLQTVLYIDWLPEFRYLFRNNAISAKRCLGSVLLADNAPLIGSMTFVQDSALRQVNEKCANTIMFALLCDALHLEKYAVARRLIGWIPNYKFFAMLMEKRQASWDAMVPKLKQVMTNDDLVRLTVAIMSYIHPNARTEFTNKMNFETYFQAQQQLPGPAQVDITITSSSFYTAFLDSDLQDLIRVLLQMPSKPSMRALSFLIATMSSFKRPEIAKALINYGRTNLKDWSAYDLWVELEQYLPVDFKILEFMLDQGIKVEIGALSSSTLGRVSIRYKIQMLRQLISVNNFEAWSRYLSTCIHNENDARALMAQVLVLPDEDERDKYQRFYVVVLQAAVHQNYPHIEVPLSDGEKEWLSELVEGSQEDFLTANEEK